MGLETRSITLLAWLINSRGFRTRALTISTRSRRCTNFGRREVNHRGRAWSGACISRRAFVRGFERSATGGCVSFLLTHVSREAYGEYMPVSDRVPPPGGCGNNNWLAWSSLRVCRPGSRRGCGSNWNCAPEFGQPARRRSLGLAVEFRSPVRIRSAPVIRAWSKCRRRAERIPRSYGVGSISEYNTQLTRYLNTCQPCSVNPVLASTYDVDKTAAVPIAAREISFGRASSRRADLPVSSRIILT